MVCLYDSKNTPGAFYSDDAQVTVHELQHATTEDNYSLNDDLNSLEYSYDEAGSLNEAISDFMSLVFSDSVFPQTSGLDPRIFSRWALGTFDPTKSHIRGAHKCPAYDSHYPNCDRFPAFELPKESNGNSLTISYVYPDGMGWPYPNNYHTNSVVEDIAENFYAQEEIHNAGMVMLGSLWDVYSAIKENHQGDANFARKAMTRLTMESVRHLPAVNSMNNHSPVTYVVFASTLVAVGDKLDDLTSDDRISVRKVLGSRGLYGFQGVTRSDWLAIGPGTNSDIKSTKTPGMFILDDPKLLKRWLKRYGKDPSIVMQNSAEGVNHELDPGETAVIWFDLQNNADVTAGGVLLTVNSTDPDLEILDESVNPGYLSQSGLNQTQIMYGKVNGTAIAATFNGVFGSTYFTTDPAFLASPSTAVWVKASSRAAHGKPIQLNLTASPSNGVSSSTTIEVTIH